MRPSQRPLINSAKTPALLYMNLSFDPRPPRSGAIDGSLDQGRLYCGTQTKSLGAAESGCPSLPLAENTSVKLPRPRHDSDDPGRAMGLYACPFQSLCRVPVRTRACMPEAHALGPHHPIDGRSADVALTQAMPQFRLRRHHQARRLVLVKRTPPDQFRAMPLQLHPEAHHQPFDRDSFFSRSISLSGILAMAGSSPDSRQLTTSS